MSNNYFSARKVLKTLAKHIYSKSSIKITFRKDMFMFDIRLRIYETSDSCWNISNFDRTKMIVLPLFQPSARLNSQNT